MSATVLKCATPFGLGAPQQSSNLRSLPAFPYVEAILNYAGHAKLSSLYLSVPYIVQARIVRHVPGVVNYGQRHFAYRTIVELQRRIHHAVRTNIPSGAISVDEEITTEDKPLLYTGAPGASVVLFLEPVAKMANQTSYELMLRPLAAWFFRGDELWSMSSGRLPIANRYSGSPITDVCANFVAEEHIHRASSDRALFAELLKSRGVATKQQLALYTSLMSTEPLSVWYWMLLNQNNTRASFPTVVCQDYLGAIAQTPQNRQRSNCFDAPRYVKALNIPSQM